MASLGTDLKVILGPPGLRARDGVGLDLISVNGLPLGARPDYDLQRTSDRENLAQALMLRLLTPLGALGSLGHATYGCRLTELIGEGKTATTRALCKTYVLAAVAQEPRVEDKAVEFAFDPASEGPSELRFTLTVRPRTGDADVSLDLAVTL
jgi:phage baseplate assembly protein W